MANFNQMSTRKLNALLNSENTSAEDKAAIEQVLNTRNSISAGAEAISGLSQEEAAAVEKAEGQTPTPANEKSAKTTKMTDEERIELANKLRAEAVNHRCEVVPFNSLEWIPGTIISIIEEKRANKVMFAVKTDDGRRIVKSHDSKLIKILEEVVEVAKKVRSNKKTQLDENGNPIEGQTQAEWTEEAIEEAVKAVINNVGKKVSYPEAGAYGEIVEGAPIVSGRIISLVPNKRQQTILYRIELDCSNEDGSKKYAHKVTTNDSLTIADTFDEVGEKVNTSFVTRRYKEVAPKVVMTPEEAFKAAEASLNKAKEALEKAQKTYDARLSKFEAAKSAYEASLKEETSADDNDMM